jgi:hypothetical protein
MADSGADRNRGYSADVLHATTLRAGGPRSASPEGRDHVLPVRLDLDFFIAVHQVEVELVD